MATDWSPPTEFHTIQLTTGTVVYVDDGTRREVEDWLDRGDAAPYTITVDDIYGSTEVLVRGFVVTIWSSTPEQRARDHAHRKMIREEVPVEDRE